MKKKSNKAKKTTEAKKIKAIKEAKAAKEVKETKHVEKEVVIHDYKESKKTTKKLKINKKNVATFIIFALLIAAIFIVGTYAIGKKKTLLIIAAIFVVGFILGFISKKIKPRPRYYNSLFYIRIRYL